MKPRAAYIKAGFKARGRVADAAASRLLKNVNIQAAIKKSREEVTKEVEKKLSFDLIDVKEELWAVASSTSKDYYDKKGNLIPIHKLSDKAAKAVASFEIEESRRGGGKLKKEKGAILKKVKIHNKTDAGKDLRRSFEGDKLDIGINKESVAKAMMDIMKAIPDKKVADAIWVGIKDRLGIE